MSHGEPIPAIQATATAAAAEVLAPEELRARAEAIGAQDPVAASFLRSVSRVAGPSGVLPLDVYQAVVEAQGKAMAEFFRSWAQSIEENARADRLAHLRAQERKAEIHELRQSSELLKRVLTHVKKHPDGRPLAGEIEGRIGPTLGRLVLMDGERGSSPPIGSRQAAQLVRTDAPDQHLRGLAAPSPGAGVTTRKA